MTKMVQIRHLPDDIHKILKLRAVKEGSNLSAFLVKELTRIAKTPSLDDIFDRIHERGKVEISEDSLNAIQAERRI